MSKFLIAAAATAAVALPMAAATPASAQYSGRYDRALHECNQNLRNHGINAHFDNLRECRRYRRGVSGGYAANDYQAWRNYDYNRYEPGYNQYYADRYYRDGQYYQPRSLSYQDRVYRGQNGQYYCRRSDGTTGLIVGGVAGGVLGNILPIGGSSTLRTIIGGAAGAALGSSIDRQQVVCR